MKICMRAFIKIAVFFLLVAGISFSYPYYFGKVSSPCDKVRTYKIGAIDSKFGYSRKDFLESAQESAKLWNGTFEKQLLAYDEASALSVNLVYDERQSLLSKIKNLEGDVSENKDVVDTQNKAFEARVADFEKRVNKLNSEIEYWNNRGGAPQEEFDRIAGEQNELKGEAQQLNEMASGFNKKVGSYNAEVKNLNKQISNFNDVLHDKPEGGIYIGGENRIEIYLATDKAELVRILAHEMGHALGIGHVANSNSIMYPLSTTASKLSSDDLEALRSACVGEENWKILSTRFQNNLQYLLSKYAIQ